MIPPESRDRAPRIFYGAVIIFIFALGFLAAWVARGFVIKKSQENSGDGLTLVRNGNYSFINPLLGFDLPEEKSSEFTKLDELLTAYATEQKKEHNVTDIGIYFRELNTGKWVGVNENMEFSPASMLKVPIMITYFKLAEANHSLLQKEILNNSKVNLNENEYFKSTSTIQFGKKYTVEELVRRMIVNSGNNSTNLLMQNIDPTIPKDIFDSLGIPEGKPNVIDYMSPKTFSLTFRTLYNATFLNREFSERALEILSQTNFYKGLAAGVPASVKVAHKFGEREARLTSGGTAFRELHDCGIIYLTDNPYFLCVMTKGTNFDTLARVIAQTSKIVYDDRIRDK